LFLRRRRVSPFIVLFFVSHQVYWSWFFIHRPHFPGPQRFVFFSLSVGSVHFPSTLSSAEIPLSNKPDFPFLLVAKLSSLIAIHPFGVFEVGPFFSFLFHCRAGPLLCRAMSNSRLSPDCPLTPPPPINFYSLDHTVKIFFFFFSPDCWRWVINTSSTISVCAISARSWGTLLPPNLGPTVFAVFLFFLRLSGGQQRLSPPFSSKRRPRVPFLLV